MEVWIGGKKHILKVTNLHTMSPTERKIREKIEEILNPDEIGFACLYGPPPFERNWRDELISLCRFYKGEDECPYSENYKPECQFFWEYEKVWVNLELEVSPNLDSGLAYLERCCPYAAKDNPDVPLGLQAIFVSRIEHWGGEPITRIALRNFIKDYKQKAKQ